MDSIFQRLGSLTAVRKLSNEFYDVMETDPYVRELRDIHPTKLHSSRVALYKFMSQWFGGPTLFGEQYVNAKWLELRHRRFDLSNRQKEQWLHCMEQAMTNLTYDPVLKATLIGHFSTMIGRMQSQRRPLTDLKEKGVSENQ